MGLLSGRGAASKAIADCQGCIHFEQDALALEAALPGLAILCSAQASVRAGDGLCLAHDRLTDGRRRCASFAVEAKES